MALPCRVAAGWCSRREEGGPGQGWEQRARGLGTGAADGEGGRGSVVGVEVKMPEMDATKGMVCEEVGPCGRVG